MIILPFFGLEIFIDRRLLGGYNLFAISDFKTKDILNLYYFSNGGYIMKKNLSKIVMFLISLISLTSCGVEGEISQSIVDSDFVDGSTSVTSDTSDTSVSNEPVKSIVINEICSKNRYSYLDTYEEDSDWIELYNTTSDSIDLNGWGLSDNRSNPYVFTFDHLVLKPNDYLVVVASGREVKINNNEYHLPFTLSQKKVEQFI